MNYSIHTKNPYSKMCAFFAKHFDMPSKHSCISLQTPKRFKNLWTIGTNIYSTDKPQKYYILHRSITRSIHRLN